MRNIAGNRVFNMILLFTIIGEFIVPWILERFYSEYNGKIMVMSVLGSPQSPVRLVYNIWLIWLGGFLAYTACVYFLTMYGGMSQIVEQDNRKMLYILATGYMVSRCLSGIGVITLPKANASGTVAEFSRKAQDTRVRNILIIYLVLLTGFMFWIQPVWGTAVIVTALLVFWFYRHKALKYFGGTTGDLSGYFLCLCEVWIVLVLAIITVVYKI